MRRADSASPACPRSSSPCEGASPALVVTDSPGEADRAAILDGLLAFNAGFVGPLDRQPLAVLVRDPDTGATVGGLLGATWHGWLHVDLLFLPEDRRGGGLGTAVMDAAEAEARRRGCRAVFLDTFSFQARGFYEKRGYVLFGTLDGFPPGHQRFFLRKPLDGATG